MTTRTLEPLRKSLLAVAWAALAAAAAPGCAERNYTKLSDREKAHLINEKRKDAEDVLTKYRATGFKDVSLIEQYVQLHRENTEIAPSTCPKCWAEYGEALSMEGWHYWYLHQEALDELEKDPKDKELKEKARALKAKWVDFFT